MAENQVTQWTWKPSPRSIGFGADENGQSRQAQHQFPIHPAHARTEPELKNRCHPRNRWGFPPKPTSFFGTGAHDHPPKRGGVGRGCFVSWFVCFVRWFMCLSVGVCIFSAKGFRLWNIPKAAQWKVYQIKLRALGAFSFKSVRLRLGHLNAVEKF